MINIGIAGMGGMGQLYKRCLDTFDDCAVKACVTSKKTEGVNVYHEFDDMLNSEKLDVVCICTPTYLHKEQVSKCLEHGINVICEKPLTFSADDARKLYEKASANHCQLLTAFVVRFSDSTRWLYDAVKQNRYGKVREAWFSRISPSPSWNSGLWSYDVKKSGHVPYDLHIHDLDLMMYLWGVPDSYKSESSGDPLLPYKEHWWFYYSYKDFNVVSEAAWYNADIPFEASWRVNFDNALAVNRNGVVTLYEHGREPAEIREKTEEQVESGFSVPASTMYTNELRYFMDRISGKTDEDIIIDEEVVKELNILESILEA